MRPLLALLLCVSAAGADLRRFDNSNRIFELRQALTETDNLYYRGKVAARFGQEETAIEQLHSFLATRPNAKMQRKAHEELADAYERLNRYGEAADEWAAALKLTPLREPMRADTENTRVLYEALRDIPPQTIEFDADTRDTGDTRAQHNPLGTWNVPVDVNGKQADWIFDTGANISTLVESEAQRLGLPVRKTSAYVEGSAGHKNPLRIAVAPNLVFGPAHLHNVVFLVLSDSALRIGGINYQIRGILGFPAIRALRRVGISATGEVRIEPGQAVDSPNMFFDELCPMIQLTRNGHRLQMFLDTGANSSSLYPSARIALEKTKLKTKQERTAGAGGTVIRTTQVIPTLDLQIPDGSVTLTNVSLLQRQPGGSARYRDGVIGMDALRDGFTLDFRAMRVWSATAPTTNSAPTAQSQSGPK
jgi:predicted aspartyl protease